MNLKHPQGFIDLQISRNDLYYKHMDLTTIERHIIDNATEDNEIANILYDINVAAKLIRQKVIRAGLNSDILGKAGTTNSSGEDVQALDITQTML